METIHVKHKAEIKYKNNIITLFSFLNISHDALQSGPQYIMLYLAFSQCIPWCIRAMHFMMNIFFSIASCSFLKGALPKVPIMLFSKFPMMHNAKHLIICFLPEILPDPISPNLSHVKHFIYSKEKTAPAQNKCSDRENHQVKWIDFHSSLITIV